MRSLTTLLTLICLALPAAAQSPIRDMTKATRNNGGIDVLHSTVTGACDRKGPVRLKAPSHTVPIRNAAAITLELERKVAKGRMCIAMAVTRTWRISVPVVDRSVKVLIIYLQRPNGRIQASAHLID